MNRRDFITLATAAGLTPAIAKASLDYTPGLVQELLDVGETIFIDFTTSWCSTCRSQSRVIDALKISNPEYERSFTFIKADWDDVSESDLVKSLRVPSRSTLIVLKGDQELGRLVAVTSEEEIKALLDTALAAATS